MCFAYALLAMARRIVQPIFFLERKGDQREDLSDERLKFIPRGLAAGSLAMGFPKGRSATLLFGRATGFMPRGGEIKLILAERHPDLRVQDARADTSGDDEDAAGPILLGLPPL